MKEIIRIPDLETTFTPSVLDAILDEMCTDRTTGDQATASEKELTQRLAKLPKVRIV